MFLLQSRPTKKFPTRKSFLNISRAKSFLSRRKSAANLHNLFSAPPLLRALTPKKTAKLAALQKQKSELESELEKYKAIVNSERCQQCTDPKNRCNSRFKRPVDCTNKNPPFDDCCNAWKISQASGKESLSQRIQNLTQEIAKITAAPSPPAPSQIFDVNNADKCVAARAMCFNRGSPSNLVSAIVQQQSFCKNADQKFCPLIGCVSKKAACVPESQCPSDKPVRCSAFSASDGSLPCVAIGTPCPSDGLQIQCASGTFICPLGLTCAPGPQGTREFYKQCMGTGDSTLTSTWNGCPPATVACPGRPFVCAPLDGSRTVQQLCGDKPGPFRCPTDQKFCGYRRNSKGRLSNGKLTPICLPSGTASCSRPDIQPLLANFTYGLPNAAVSGQTIQGVLPDGSPGRLVAKFGGDRKGDLPSGTPLFFTGDGTKTDKALSFSVGPIAGSVAQYGPYADVIDSGRLLSPIVSITPSDAVVVNPDATAKNSGLYLSIPLSDQGDPNDPTLRLSDQANCDRTVANLAVYAIDNEDDDSAEAAANCIGELIQDTVSGATLCSCKFLVPHFSAFAVVDTSPSDDGPAPDGGASADVSSASGAALSAVVLAASALLLL